MLKIASNALGEIQAYRAQVIQRTRAFCTYDTSCAQDEPVLHTSMQAIATSLPFSVQARTKQNLICQKNEETTNIVEKRYIINENYFLLPLHN